MLKSLKKVLLLVIACALVIGAIYIAATGEEVMPPEGCPSRTDAFADIFDTLYHIYPEANSGTCTVVFQLIDFNEVDYGCAIDSIKKYCEVENIPLICARYGDDIPAEELDSDDNLVVTFSKLRYKGSNTEHISISFQAQKYRPGVAGYSLDVVCQRKDKAWNCFWTDAKELNMADIR